MRLQGLSPCYALALAALTTLACPAWAQAPGEVTGLVLTDDETLAWDPVPGAEDYNVYRGLAGDLARGRPGRCHGDEIAAAGFSSPASPEAGGAYFYLVTAESAGGEGSPGQGSDALERALLGSCDTVVRNHVLNRAGYGWDEWSRDQIASLGIDAYLDAQLDPASIDESSNTVLNDRLAELDPPDDQNEHFAQLIVRGTYARRQLEQQVAAFFSNHFNTYYYKISDYYERRFPACPDPPNPWCDPEFPAKARRLAANDQRNETEGFRDLAFNGTFREMVEFSFLSPAMLHYLDTVSNVAAAPNENYARELLELHTMDVDRYTQQDVVELARVLTGWNVCAKSTLALGPLDPCQLNYWAGHVHVANFRIPQHDCGEKALFAGTPQETIIPDTCDGMGDPTADGVNDLGLALDAIVAHPATPRFIAKKLIELLVTEEPGETMIDSVIAAWNDGGNPRGVGDMREVLRAVLALPELRDPDRIGSKVKTPLEQVNSAFRATRGKTNGTTRVIAYLGLLQHRPYFNTVPTGYAEAGGAWIDTNNVLERQNFSMEFTTNENPGSEPNFGADIIPLLQDNGVPTGPGNAEQIVDFFIDALFGGALTPAERQEAIDYLSTDDLGAPAPYDETRIRETVGFLLGYAHFQEQ